MAPAAKLADHIQMIFNKLGIHTAEPFIIPLANIGHRELHLRQLADDLLRNQLLHRGAENQAVNAALANHLHKIGRVLEPLPVVRRIHDQGHTLVPVHQHILNSLQ